MQKVRGRRREYLIYLIVNVMIYTTARCSPRLNSRENGECVS